MEAGRGFSVLTRLVVRAPARHQLAQAALIVSHWGAARQEAEARTRRRGRRRLAARLGAVALRDVLEVELRAPRLRCAAVLGDHARERVLRALRVAHVQVGLAQRVEQLRFAPRTGVTPDRAFEAHRRCLGVIALQIEACDVDLVIDEALHHLAPDLVGLLHVRRRRELLAEVVDLALRIDDRRLILLVGRRQQPTSSGMSL